jgi:two-component system sensor histidine kinase ChiS
MTADNRIENMTLSFQRGVNDYLSKPFNRQELLLRVTTLINLKHSVAEAIALARDMNVVKKQVEDLNLRNAESERKMDELIEYDKLKTEFFTNISHELRTPLNVISSTVQLLKSLDPTRQLGEESIRKYLKIMNNNCYRLLRLINNLIDTTRLDGGYIKLHLKNNNIVSVIEDITQSVAEYIKSKNIDIIFDTEVEEKYLAIDEDMIERIMLNLLSNAVKFTNEKGKIFINIMDLGNFVEIRVRDTGIGIPEDKIDYVFERFAQVDKTTTRKTEGSGIGLSLVKSLIEMHEGTIRLKSKLGEGSEFIITLPVREVVEETPKPKEALLQDIQKENNKNIQLEFSDIYAD